MKILKYSPEAARDLENIKRIVAEEFGESVAVKTMKRIGKGIRTLEIAENAGIDLCKKYGIICDYRVLIVVRNYVIYRIEEEFVRIIRVVNERQDFIQVLFGIETPSGDSEGYWNETDGDV